MKKIFLLILLLAVPSISLAEAKYVDVRYDDTRSVLPEEQGWFQKLLSNQERKVFLVVSIFLSNGADGETLLLAPPRILQSFERTETELRRSRSENLNLLTAQFVTDSEQLILKVEFFSVKKTQASAFTESLKSLGAAFVAAGATPAASKLATSAMDAIESILLENKAVYLTYTGGISTENVDNPIRLYFDDSGNINDSMFDGADASQTVLFRVKAAAQFSVDFDLSFENQGVNPVEKGAYRALAAAEGPANRQAACQALRQTLKRRFSKKTATDLLAIAIDDIGWAQDETQFNCIAAERAVEYRRNHGLTKIANCVTDECIKTKKTVFLIKGNAPADIIKRVAGADVYSMNCKLSTKFLRLYRWSNVQAQFESEDFKTYDVESCLETKDGKFPYVHTFSWLGGTLTSHSCEKLQGVEKSCQ
jgi:hypothetical protein